MPEDVSAELGDRYSSVTYISSGATASVFSALDAGLDKKVAIKVLKNVNERDLIEFQKEAKAAAKLDHKNLVSILNFGKTEKNRGYLIMGFVDGQSLDSLVEERGRLPLPLALNLLIQICDGLKHAHSKHIAHRDLKTSNIMVWNIDNDPSAVVVDFGLAKERKDQEESKMGIGVAVGSPLYMSAEQANGMHGDERSDIYGLACIAYRIISGHTPFEAEELFDLLLMHINAEPPLLSELATDVDLPSELDNCLLKMLAKDPADRFQTIDEVGEILRGIAHSINVIPPPSTPHHAAPAQSLLSKLKPKLHLLIPTLAISTIVLVTLAFAGLVVLCSGTSSAKTVKVAEVKTFNDYFIIDEDNRFMEHAAKEHAQPISKQTINDANLAVFADPKVKPVAISLAHTEKITGVGFKYLDREGFATLDLAGTNLSQEGYLQLSKMRYIERLGLDKTNVSDEAIALISKMPSLRALNLDSCPNISEKALLHLSKNAKKLEELDLNKNAQFSGDMFKHLVDCTELRRLDADETNVSDASIEPLVTLKHLNELKLSTNKGITDKTFLAITTKMPNRIEVLGLGRTGITTKYIPRLAKCTKLKWLALQSLPLSDKDMDVIGTLTGLHQIFLSGTEASDEALFRNVMKLAKLETTSILNSKLSTTSRKKIRDAHPKGGLFGEVVVSSDEFGDAHKASFEFIMESQAQDIK